MTTPPIAPNKLIPLPNDRPRSFEFSLKLLSFTNLTREDMSVFFQVSVLNNQHNEQQQQGETPLLSKPITIPQFTESFYSEKGDAIETNLSIYHRKILNLSFSDLSTHSIKIDMWKLNNWSFNTMYGGTQLSLISIADGGNPNQSVMLKKKLTEDEEKDKKKSFDVARLVLIIEFREIFDYYLSFDNWSVLNCEELENYSYVYLDINCPTSLSRKSRKNSKIIPVKTSVAKASFNSIYFKFSGTQNALENSFFTLCVYGVNSKVVAYYRGKLIGKTLCNLMSVLTIPLFKSKLKDLYNTKFIVGQIVGNVSVTTCSLHYPIETDIPRRPSQKLLTSVLKPTQYLVVHVLKFENLPISNPEEGKSDPLVRVKYDGNVQSSFTVYNTTRPVFNYFFYFPIRFFDDKILKYPHLLTEELHSKGFIHIEVWDEEATSSHFLGGCYCKVSDILTSKLIETKNSIYSSKDEEGQSSDCRVYDGRKDVLSGSKIKIDKGVSHIFYEAYFYPDLPMDVTCADGGVNSGRMDMSDESENLRLTENNFTDYFDKFKHHYLHIFPDAVPKERFFLPTSLHPQIKSIFPLSSFLCPIVPADTFVTSLNVTSLLHFINSMAFVNPPRFERTGMIESWSTISFFLSARQGSVQDHCLILCCLLLGLGYDAYVVKGRIPATYLKKKNTSGFVDHTWCMIRFKNSVSFWDVLLFKIWHLPNRINLEQVDTIEIREDLSESSIDVSGDRGRNVEDINSDIESDFGEEEDTGCLPDVKIDLTSLSHNTPRKQNNKTSLGREEAQKLLLNMRTNSSIGPVIFDNLMSGEESLNLPPYSSVEIIFNNKNVWGNLQNHHPCCIWYNINCSKYFRPLFASDVDPPPSIESDIVLGPSIELQMCETIAHDMMFDLVDNIRLYRSKLGVDSIFDSKPKLMNRLFKYIDVLEEFRKLDADFCPSEYREELGLSIPSLNATSTSTTGGNSPFLTDVKYVERQNKLWMDLFQEYKSLKQKIDDFPVKRGMRFTGYPVHFSSADPNIIRTHLFNWPPFKQMLDEVHKDIVFVLCFKLYPLVGGVLSVWTVVGSQQHVQGSSS